MKVEVVLSIDLKRPLGEGAKNELRRHIKRRVLAADGSSNDGPFFRGIKHVACGPVKEVFDTPHDARVAGGKARAKNLSSEKRKEIASMAAKARWAKLKKQSKRAKLERA